MRYFASIDTDLICIGIQSSEGDVIADNVIEVTAQVESGTALEDFQWRKYVNGVWSVDKFEPIQPTAEELKQQRILALKAELAILQS